MENKKAKPSREAKEHLFVIFIIGGLYGAFDSGNYNIGYFIGSGIGMLILAGGLGKVIHFVLDKTGAYNSLNPHSEVLDMNIVENELKIVKDELNHSLKAYKYGIFLAIVFFIVLSL